MPDPISAGIQAGAGIAQTVVGLINAGKAKREAEKLERTRPKYAISPLAGQDLSLAESELGSGGLSATAENAYNSLNNKQFSASLGAILRGGGSVNNVADLYGNNEEGRQRLALLSDQMRLQKIDRLSRAREMMRDEQDKKWQINEFSPWRDKAAANAAARQGAEDMIWNGIGTTASAGMSYFGQKNNENNYNDYFNPPTQSSGITMDSPHSSFQPVMDSPHSQNIYDYNYQPPVFWNRPQ